MNHSVQRLARSVHLAGLLAATGLFPDGVAAQAPVPLQAGTSLFVLDLAGTPVGEIPTAIEQRKGILEVVLKDGVPLLKASAASESRITLLQALPRDFTLEFDVVPKACCNPQDLSFEGTPDINQGAGSAQRRLTKGVSGPAGEVSDQRAVRGLPGSGRFVGGSNEAARKDERAR